MFSHAQFSAAKKLLLAQSSVPPISYTVDTFFTSSTWVCPEGVTEVTVIAIGGGGGGGYAHSLAYLGAGGGGGGFSQSTLSVTPGETYDVFVGEGGLADDNSVYSGTPSSFEYNGTKLVYAHQGELGGTSSAGLGGPAEYGIGDIKYSGGNGDTPLYQQYSGGGGGAAGTSGNGNNADGPIAGGEKLNLGGAGGEGLTEAGTGNPGFLYGGGGSGGYYGGTRVAGGSGADGIVIISYGEAPSTLSCPEIINVASTGTFQMAHSLITDGTYIYVGERINNATPTEIARIIKYNASTLAEVSSYSVGANRDVESMVYNSGNNIIYASQIYDNGVSTVVSIMRINPSNMTLIDTTVYNSLISGESFAIVTDGTYIYGVTHASSSQFFKIRLSDMELVASTTWGRIRGHAAKLDSDNGVMYVSHVAYDATDNMFFAKVNLSDLSYTEVEISDYVRRATDDFAMVKSGGETYCYVGSEYVYSSGGNAGYGGVRVRTSDLSLTGISLKTTYALGEAGNVVYSTTIDGNIQVFDISDLNTVTTCNLGGYFGNEFIRLGIYGYITNFNAYNESDGKLIRISLTE